MTSPKSFCRVEVRLHPIAGSNIRAEFWLPAIADWNGQFINEGNGGFSGSIGGQYIGMQRGLGAGYASGGTDSGHTGAAEDASWALHNPIGLDDYAYRANHVTLGAAKELIATFYGRDAAHAYFDGCSNGGREALMQARRYPDDYDAIISGAPAMAFSRVMTSFAWNARAMETPGAALSTQDLALLHRAVLDRCDALDGARDGVIEDPRNCPFDAAELRCTSQNQGACLSDAQIDAVRSLRRGPATSSGQQILPGFEWGSESGWNDWITGANAVQRRMAESFFRYMVHDDPRWSISQLNLDADYTDARSGPGATIDSDNPDLTAFFRRGGKLLMYVGWTDAAISPQSTIDQYNSIRGRIGASHNNDIRLFVVPGMDHCGGGAGVANFDAIGALDHWVHTHEAPTQIIAVKHENEIAAFLGRPTRVVATRPVCAWPNRVTYNGAGPTNDAASFSCRTTN
ncbi:MAG: tannase/feruloyl esterase family alpha/beta hydrolase [Terricaulis sp.]